MSESCELCGTSVVVADNVLWGPVLLELPHNSRTQRMPQHTPGRCHAVKANRGLA